MVWLGIYRLFLALVDLISVRRLAEHEKDLELVLLRQQLDILQRTRRPPRIARGEKLVLVAFTARLKQVRARSARPLGQIVRLFKPETVLRWHRDLVARKWTFKRPNPGGRPRTDPALEQLVVRLARENARWGYAKIRGELLKLRHRVGETTVATILLRHGIQPAPQRAGAIGWRHLMRHYKAQILACDLFTVETLFLQTLYVCFFIELGSRQVHVAGCTRHPDIRWITQQARQMVWQLEEREPAIHFLIHDNDSKFAPAFDAVFQAAGVHVIHTPFRAPNANAYAERWVRTVREECLDRLFILSAGHLHHVLGEYVDYYNRARPHQGLQQQAPIPFPQASAQSAIHCRDVLGGILHDYHREAA